MENKTVDLWPSVSQSAAEGPMVRRLSGGERWIRTLGPPWRRTHSSRRFCSACPHFPFARDRGFENRLLQRSSLGSRFRRPAPVQGTQVNFAFRAPSRRVFTI